MLRDQPFETFNALLKEVAGVEHGAVKHRGFSNFFELTQKSAG